MQTKMSQKEQDRSWVEVEKIIPELSTKVDFLHTIKQHIAKLSIEIKHLGSKKKKKTGGIK